MAGIVVCAVIASATVTALAMSTRHEPFVADAVQTERLLEAAPLANPVARTVAALPAVDRPAPPPVEGKKSAAKRLPTVISDELIELPQVAVTTPSTASSTRAGTIIAPAEDAAAVALSVQPVALAAPASPSDIVQSIADYEGNGLPPLPVSVAALRENALPTDSAAPFTAGLDQPRQTRPTRRAAERPRTRPRARPRAKPPVKQASRRPRHRNPFDSLSR
ncbi:MAG: hypothetical protein AAFQ42_01560 [Pseudomonadota bacterium]